MTASFPAVRMRRLRRSEPVRDLVRETTLSARDFIYPMFVVPGHGVSKEIASMPGCFHLSPDEAVRESEEVLGLGVPSVLLFGLPASKDAVGQRPMPRMALCRKRSGRSRNRYQSSSSSPTSACASTPTTAIAASSSVRRSTTTKAWELISRTAVSHAMAGADIVAPSDMMDGRVKAIRSSWTPTIWPKRRSCLCR